MTRRIRFGLIVTGRIGQVHFRTLTASPDTELTWIADAFPDAARELAESVGAKVSADPFRLIGSGEVDAVVIASPTSTHLELIEEAIDRGVAVLCEKPIDLDIDRVDGLRDKAAASQVPVALGFNRRMDPAFSEVRSRVEAGEIGTLEGISIVSRDPAPPPEAYLGVSGGIFRDMTIHDLDMARFFVDDIVEVSASGSCLFDENARRLGDFDSAVVTLVSRAGVLISITNSRHSATGHDQRLEAFGSAGTLNVLNASTSLVTASTASSVESRATYQEFFLERYSEAYRLEIEEFVKLLRGEPSRCATYEDGRAALLLANAAQLSAESGRRIAVDLGRG